MKEARAYGLKQLGNGQCSLPQGVPRQMVVLGQNHLFGRKFSEFLY